jgi:hypothetical protein
MALLTRNDLAGEALSEYDNMRVELAQKGLAGWLRDNADDWANETDIEVICKVTSCEHEGEECYATRVVAEEAGYHLALAEAAEAMTEEAYARWRQR